jgi:hypothetical protein
MKCCNCGQDFDPANRVRTDANSGAIDEVKYCSEKCARQAENKRYYQAHKQQVIDRVLARQKQQKKKRKPIK